LVESGSFPGFPTSVDHGRQSNPSHRAYAVRLVGGALHVMHLGW